MVHVKKCPCEYARGKPLHEFTFAGHKYSYCMGWINKRNDELIDICKHCPDHVDKAQDDLDAMIKLSGSKGR